jgi:cell division GTPase FtsZ
MDNSSADAVFLVDNQKFVRGNQTMTYNYEVMNRKIADSFMDILCVGEETDRRYIGEVLDANDVIRILKGPTAIGVSHTQIPKKQTSLLGRFRNSSGSKSNHFSVAKDQIERAQNVLHQALGELSIDCELWEGGESRYDAQSVLGLFSGPSDEATEEIVEMMDNTLAERVPGAGRRKGTYPGRISDTISFTVIVSNIGEGAAMDKIESFFTDASRMLGEVQVRREGRQKQWATAAKAAAQLPNL